MKIDFLEHETQHGRRFGFQVVDEDGRLIATIDPSFGIKELTEISFELYELLERVFTRYHFDPQYYENPEAQAHVIAAIWAHLNGDPHKIIDGQEIEETEDTEETENQNQIKEDMDSVFMSEITSIEYSEPVDSDNQGRGFYEIHSIQTHNGHVLKACERLIDGKRGWFFRLEKPIDGPRTEIELIKEAVATIEKRAEETPWDEPDFQ